MSDLRSERERVARRWSIIASVSITAIFALLAFCRTMWLCAIDVYGTRLGTPTPTMCGIVETWNWLNGGAPWALWPLAIVIAFFVSRAILRDLK